MNKLYPDATAALAGILKDGMTILAGGFGLCGIPEALFETTVRPFTPEARIASISASGMPQRPKPPARIVMPSFRMPARAAVASG